MSFSYSLDKVSKLGDFDETYGQRYWCESPDEDKALSFNSKEDIELTETSGAIHITAEERTEKQSKKGTVYYQLKKVKVVSGSEGQGAHPPVDSPTQASQNPGSAVGQVSSSEIDRLNKKLDLILEGINDLKGISPEEY
jgi:hypothetical protein